MRIQICTWLTFYENRNGKENDIITCVKSKYSFELTKIPLQNIITTTTIIIYNGDKTRELCVTQTYAKNNRIFYVCYDLQ